MTTCNACGGPKPDDRFRACPDCRAAWRAQNRKPGGYADRIDRLTRQRDQLAAAAEALLASPHGAPYRRISPFRELQIAVDKAREQ